MTDHEASVRVALLQIASGADESKPTRLERVHRLLSEIPGRNDIIVLPELWPVGYFQFDRYAEEAEDLAGPTTEMLRDAAIQRRIYVLGGSLVERDDAGRLYNTSLLIDPTGDTVLTYRKIHLFGYRSRETELLTPGDALAVVDTPFGCVGVTTCYDIRFPELYRLLLDRGIEILLIPSAWPRARLEHWLLLTRARALENQLFLAACNACGAGNGTELAGNSVVVDPWGTIIAQAGEDEEVLTATLDRREQERVRRDFPVLADRRLRVQVA